MIIYYTTSIGLRALHVMGLFNNNLSISSTKYVLYVRFILK